MFLTFENHLYLWFLFFIPVLIFAHYYFLKRSRSKALIFSNVSALRRLSKKKLITSNITHLIIRCLIIFFFVVAASGATLWVMGERADVNVIFAVDSSPSMTAGDVGESRFVTAKQMVSGIINMMPRGGDLALINFAGATFIQKSFTDERADILLALEGLEISRLGGTDLGGAIVTAANLFELRPDEGKVLIILSDGLANRGSFISGSPSEIIDYARDNQVVIYSIGIGSEGGPIGYLEEYYDIPAMFDEELLVGLSEGTGGDYFLVESVEDVPDVISQLSFESSRAFINYNLYYWAFLVVFVLLFFEWVVANTIYRRVL